MEGKSFAVIGLGQFGRTLAKELANSECDVLAIDDKDENVIQVCETEYVAECLRQKRI